MNKIIGIGLLFLYLIALIRPVAPYIEYAINKDYIAKVLCINKSKPELHCNGKCYLNRQLEKVNETDRSDNTPVPPKIELEKYPISLISENYFSNRLPYCHLKTALFSEYSFKIKVFFLDVPTPPPKVFC